MRVVEPAVFCWSDKNGVLRLCSGLILWELEMLRSSSVLSMVSMPPHYRLPDDVRASSIVDKNNKVPSAIGMMRVLTKNNAIKQIQIYKVGIIDGSLGKAYIAPLALSERELKATFVNRTHAAKGHFFKEKDVLLGVDQHAVDEPLPRFVAHPGLGLTLAGPYLAPGMDEEEYAPARIDITVMRPTRSPSDYEVLPNSLRKWLAPKPDEMGHLMPRFAYTQRELVGWYCVKTERFFAITQEAFDANVHVARLLKENIEEWHRRGPLLAIADYKRYKKEKALIRSSAILEGAERRAQVKQAYTQSIQAHSQAERARKNAKMQEARDNLDMETQVALDGEQKVVGFERSDTTASDLSDVGDQAFSKMLFNRQGYAALGSAHATRKLGISFDFRSDEVNREGRYGIVNQGIQIDESPRHTPFMSAQRSE